MVILFLGSLFQSATRQFLRTIFNKLSFNTTIANMDTTNKSIGAKQRWGSENLD